MAELTDSQIEEEQRFMKGIPPLNIAALLLPPIWGPAHGIWSTILFYPIWLFADNCFYSAYMQATPVAAVMAAVVFICLLGITVVFARLSQPFVAHRYIDERGWTKEAYIKRQRIWAICCAIVGAAMLAAATYYNVAIRPTLG